MNNWRLLLFAIVAVVQPIASYTERNFDGRHQCCDHQSRPLLRDSRESLYGTNQIPKTTEERRLSQRNEIRENRRHEIKQHDLAISRPSLDASLLRIRERGTRKIPTRSLTKFTRSEYRRERIAVDYNRERISPKNEHRIIRNTRDTRFEHSRRVVKENRGQNDGLVGYSRLSRDRDVSRTRRIDERLSEYAPDTQRDTHRIQIMSHELRRTSRNRESQNVFKQTRNVAIIRDETLDVLMNRRQVRDRSDVEARERSVKLQIRRSLDNNNERAGSERRTSVYRGDTRLLSSDTRAFNEVRDIRVKEGRGNVDARLIRTTRFDDQGQPREEARSRDRTINNRREIRSTEVIRESRRQNRDDERRFRENSENRRENRNAEQRKEIRDNERLVRERNSQSRREVRSAERMNDIRDNERRVRERNSESRREVRSAERMNDIRDNERRVRDRNTESRREVRSAERMNDIRDNERRVRERNTESRRDVRTAERMNDIRYNERRVRERNNESPREVRSAERMADIRDNERRVRERNSENPREVWSAERMNDIRDNERRARERNSESRREVRSAARMNDIRDNERRVREQNSESRREVRSAERIDDSRDNERRVRDRNIESRREVRSAERMNDIRDRERRFREQNSGSRGEVRSAAVRAETIRETRYKERQLRENGNNKSRYIENRDDIKNNRKDVTNDERHYRFRNSESRMDTTSKVKENRNVRREIINGERRFRENRDATINRNRREVRNIRNLREIQDTKSANGRRVAARTDGALERDNVMLDRRARAMELKKVQDNKAETRLTRSDVSREHEGSCIRIKFLNNDETTSKETVDTRFQNIEATRNSENSVASIHKEDQTDESVFANWQYVFYTLQGVYLCGLMQVLTPKVSEKFKTGNWWQLNSQRLIKVD